MSAPASPRVTAEGPASITLGGAVLDWSRTHLMGVVNVTPDSFSDGGRFLDTERAIAQGVALAEAGADILDVGGESTRPGADPVPADAELARVIPVIEALVARTDTPVSIDTYKAEVARAACEAGATLVNDIGGLTLDPELADATAEAGAALVVGHIRGTPQTMQADVRYDDVVAEVAEGLGQAVDRAIAAGVERDRILVDPGIGFGKSVTGNLTLLRGSADLRARLGRPVLIGPSRKSFIGKLAGSEVDDRLPGTLAALAVGRIYGADVVRVHDVAEAWQAAVITDAILTGSGATPRGGPVIEFVSGIFSALTTRGMLLAALDVLIVAYLIYRVLLMIRGTRAAQMTAGLVILGVAYLGSTRFELGTLGWLLDNFLKYFIILVIVVFQDDIRRALMRMGRRMFLARRQREETYLVEEVVRAVERMARLRTGALIVFERVAALDEFIQPGTVLDSQVSREMLWSIFRVDAENPVHDGAVVIRNLRIFQAGALLPLSQETELERSLGTRHRAALGITEETDAVAVVVSEERGFISLCHLGQIVRNVDIDDLRATLLDIFRKPRKGTMQESHESHSNVEKPAEGKRKDGTKLISSAPADAGGQR